MKMNPSDIQHKEFSLALRGYNKKEVRNFLSVISRAYQELLQKNRKLSEKLNILERKLQEYQSREKNIENTLISAQGSASQIIQQSQEKASITIKEAEIKAKKIIEEGRGELNKIKKEMERLSTQKRNFIIRLKELLTYQQELLQFYEEDTSKTNDSTPPLPSSFFSSGKKIVLEED